MNTARELVDPDGFIGDARGLDVLCLAAGGGQQTPAFGLLGANVTCIDLSGGAAGTGQGSGLKHYGLDREDGAGGYAGPVRVRRGLFRCGVAWTLAEFRAGRTDGVRAGEPSDMRKGGLYRLSCCNPYFHGIDEEEWNGDAYPLRNRYEEGE